MNEMRVSELSQRDLERLSAYLDGELNAKQTARLEARLEREGVLRDALTELRQTAQLLGAMPQVSPPRRFLLTPDMIERRKPKPAYPVLKLASALAVAAFVFVIGIDVFGTMKGAGELLSGVSQRSIAEAPAMEADVTKDEDMAFAVEETRELADEETAAPLAEPALEAYEPDSIAEGEGIQETPLPEAEMAAEEMEEQEVIEPEEPTDTMKSQGGVDNVGEAMDDESLQDGFVGAEAAPTMTASLEDKMVVGEYEQHEKEWSLDQVEPIRLLEIGLAILCIVLISTTLLLRVSSR